MTAKRDSSAAYNGAALHQGAAMTLQLQFIEQLISSCNAQADGQVAHLLLSPTAHNEYRHLAGDADLIGGALVSRTPAVKGYWCVLVTTSGEWWEERIVDAHVWKQRGRSWEVRRERTK